MNTRTIRWFERVTIALSALALVITFVSLPNSPTTTWGWFVFATGLFALGIVATAALLQRRCDHAHRGSFLFSHMHASSLWLVVWVITLGELTTGILLILGLFTGLAAFAGASLNLLYLFAGSAGINPVMLILSIFLLMAWKVAGHYGLDRILLPFVERRLPPLPGTNGSRIRGPRVALQPSALSMDEAHGFE